MGKHTARNVGIVAGVAVAGGAGYYLLTQVPPPCTPGTISISAPAHVAVGTNFSVTGRYCGASSAPVYFFTGNPPSLPFILFITGMTDVNGNYSFNGLHFNAPGTTQSFVSNSMTGTGGINSAIVTTSAP